MKVIGLKCRLPKHWEKSNERSNYERCHDIVWKNSFIYERA